jgi:hypothetical protein
MPQLARLTTSSGGVGHDQSFPGPTLKASSCLVDKSRSSPRAIVGDEEVLQGVKVLARLNPSRPRSNPPMLPSPAVAAASPPPLAGHLGDHTGLARSS